MEILFVSSKTCTRENGIFFCASVCAKRDSHYTHTHIQVHAYNKKKICNFMFVLFFSKFSAKKKQNIFVNLNRFFFSKKKKTNDIEKREKNNSITHKIQNMWPTRKISKLDTKKNKKKTRTRGGEIIPKRAHLFLCTTRHKTEKENPTRFSCDDISLSWKNKR